MDRTVRTLTDLSAVDDQLSRKEALMGGLALALEQRRATLREAVPGSFLAAYDALSRMSRLPFVVQVRGAHCGGCYLRLPPQLDSSIRQRQFLCPCPHCGRLLYSPSRAEDSENATESKHETGDRLAGNVRKSKRARGISGKRRTRQKARGVVGVR